MCGGTLVPPFSFRQSLARIKHRYRAGIHRSEPRVKASMPLSRNLSNTALTIGLTAVLPVPCYARDCALQMRARPMNVSV